MRYGAARRCYTRSDGPARRRPGKDTGVRGSLHIGRIFGIPLAVNVSWILILLLVVSTLATQAFPTVLPDLPTWGHWLLALATAVVFFAAMIVHELAHSLVARRFDIPVRGITLFLLGAVAQTGRESRSAGQEFLIAVAGPVTSILIGGGFMVLWFLTGAGATPFGLVCEWLWLTNVAVGLFNLLPAYPMDGGRLLRAALWHLTRDDRRATRWAARVGRGFAFSLIGVGVLIALGLPVLADGTSPFNALQFILIGLFINFAARQSDLQAGLFEHLRRYRAADVMLRDLPVALGSTPVADALAGPLAGYGPARDWLLVSDGARFIGVAPRLALEALPPERRALTALATLVVPPARLLAAPPDEPLDELVQRMDGEGRPLVVVVDGGEVVGLVHRGLIGALLRTRGEPVRG
jgi:Zn-dependent protease